MKYFSLLYKHLPYYFSLTFKTFPRYSTLGVKIRNLKVDFKTRGTWHRVGQWTLIMTINDLFIRLSHLVAKHVFKPLPSGLLWRPLALGMPAAQILAKPLIFRSRKKIHLELSIRRPTFAFRPTFQNLSKNILINSNGNAHIWCLPAVVYIFRVGTAFTLSLCPNTLALWFGWTEPTCRIGPSLPYRWFSCISKSLLKEIKAAARTSRANLTFFLIQFFFRYHKVLSSHPRCIYLRDNFKN